MCGLFGFYLKRPLDEKDILLGKTGMDALHHRGPDFSNYWTDPEKGIFLGHTRLSIIDLSEQSNQPMIRHDTVLIYNGEIYNYRELAQELLKQGASFTSLGDTEVLLQSWHRWGRDCVNHFDGMFAFALYHNGFLYLATDSFGEKPLYWVQTKEGIYFSSEPGPLVKLLRLTPDFKEEEIIAFLSFGFLPEPSTGYKNLYRMGPGTWITYSEKGEIHKEKYWTPEEPEACKGPVRRISESELDAICDALIASLHVRLRADVPLAIFLSSGIDSTLVAALTAKELHCNLLALTVKFPDKDVADESQAASAIAGYLGLPHKVVDSGNDPARKDPTLIFELFGEANDNITVAAAHQMSLVTSSNLKIKVTLSGIGGDELFYGYNKYLSLYKWRRWLSLNERVRKIIASLYHHFFPDRWTSIMALLSASDACRFIAVKNIHFCRWLWELPEIEKWAQKLFPPRIPIELIGRYFDLIHTLPATFIPAIERGSMRASLEVRTPFLNKKLFNVISKLDQRAFFAFGHKSVLHRILSRYIPESLFDIPKKGFIYPVGRIIERFIQTPQLPFLTPSHVEEAWQYRHHPGWQRLALRLVILEYFMNSLRE